MKSRPRKIERKVAEILSKEFVAHGLSPVKRIPILGRTGPDISLNEIKFVIDVKSRLEVPKLFHMPPGPCVLMFDNGLIAFALENIASLLDNNMGTYEWFPKTGASKVVNDYYAHMDEWTKANEPAGITMLVLHRSGIHGGRMPVGHSSVVISRKDYQALSNFPRRIT